MNPLAIEAFRKVWQHFVVEGNGPSISINGSCKYRLDDGRKCAAGVLLADEDYDPTCEGGGVDQFGDDYNASFRLEHSPLLAAALRTLDPLGSRYTLADCLQSAHDREAVNGSGYGSFSVGVRETLEAIARRFGIEIPV
jgi:hypothetical protein